MKRGIKMGLIALGAGALVAFAASRGGDGKRGGESGGKRDVGGKRGAPRAALAGFVILT